MSTTFICKRCSTRCMITTTTNEALPPDNVCPWTPEEEDSATWEEWKTEYSNK